MKKISFIILAICAVSYTYGQAGAGLKAGLNLANVRSTENDLNSRLGWYAGLLVQADISEKILFRPELLYSIKGYAFPATVYTNKGTLGLHYLNLPLLFGYRASDRITILLGPELGYLLKAKSKTSNIGSVNVTNSYKRFDKGIDLGIAYNLEKLGVELRYNYGLRNRASQNLSGENRVLQLGVYCIL